MLRTLIVVCLIVAGLPPSSIYAQFGMGNRSDRDHPAFSPKPHPVFDVLNFRDPAQPDSTRVDLYLAVPYHTLQFLYSIDNYLAEYTVSVRITQGDTAARSPGNANTTGATSMVVRDLFASYSILEPVAEHEASMEPADAQQLSFYLAPGNGYHCQLTLHDSYAQRDFDTSFDLTVKRFAANETGMSDLLLFRDRKGMNIVPSIGPDVSSLEARAAAGPNRKADHAAAPSESKGIFAELYNMPANSDLGIVTEITGKDSTGNSSGIISRSAITLHTPAAAETERTFTAPSTATYPPVTTTPMFATLDVSHLWPGIYELHTYVLPSLMDTNISDPSKLAMKSIANSERRIRVRIAQGIPVTLTDLDQALEQLRIIATSTEWDSLSTARTLEQKRNAILDFWAHKNLGNASNSVGSYSGGNQAMEVFYSRIEYANEHFGTAFGAGWKSDRGRVYIALGAPDQIQDYAEGYSQTVGGMQRPYQQWDYTRFQMRYIFVDDYNLGDYRLHGAFPPEGTFQY